MGPSKDNKKNHKLKPWLFSLCSKITTDAVSVSGTAPSLGQYLMAERRARNQCSSIYGGNGFSPVQESNSPFVGGQVALSSSASLGEDGRRETNRALEQNNGYGTPIIFSCLCG